MGTSAQDIRTLLSNQVDMLNVLLTDRTATRSEFKACVKQLAEMDAIPSDDIFRRVLQKTIELGVKPEQIAKVLGKKPTYITAVALGKERFEGLRQDTALRWIRDLL